jgi:hypothetical protein
MIDALYYFVVAAAADCVAGFAMVAYTFFVGHSYSYRLHSYSLRYSCLHYSCLRYSCLYSYSYSLLLYVNNYNNKVLYGFQITIPNNECYRYEYQITNVIDTSNNESSNNESSNNKSSNNECYSIPIFLSNYFIIVSPNYLFH